MFALSACNNKNHFQNIASGMKKENVLLAQHSYLSPPLEDAKNLARIFSTYFENNTLKNKTREPVTNVTTAYNFFRRHHLFIRRKIHKLYL